MGMSRWQTAGGVVCLVAGPLGQLAQFLVSPVDEGASPSEQVSAAAAHAPAMGAATVLDVLLLLLLPAVLYAGMVAGGTRSRLAMAGTALSFASMLGPATCWPRTWWSRRRRPSRTTPPRSVWSRRSRAAGW